MGYGYWAIHEKKTGRFIADVGFADFRRVTEPLVKGLPEAGWVLTPWAREDGYASEAVAAALAWLDQDSQSNKIVCLIDGANTASLRIAKKNSFLPAGEVEVYGTKVSLFSRYL